MKMTITLTPDVGRDSEEEIRRELKVIQDITGMSEDEGNIKPIGGARCAVFEMEFHEFYQKVKDRIMRRIKAYS